MNRTLCSLIAMLAAAATQIHASDWRMGIGLRDTRYAFARVEYDSHWALTVEQSLYSQSFASQRLGFAGAFRLGSPAYELSASPYATLTYNNAYHTIGAQLSASYILLKRLHLSGTVDFHYDSQLHYSTYYAFGLNCDIVSDVAAGIKFTDIPLYRQRERRLEVGALFRIKALKASPMLAIPVSSPHQTISVLASIEYEFSL